MNGQPILTTGDLWAIVIALFVVMTVLSVCAVVSFIREERSR